MSKVQTPAVKYATACVLTGVGGMPHIFRSFQEACLRRHSSLVLSLSKGQLQSRKKAVLCFPGSDSGLQPQQKVSFSYVSRALGPERSEKLHEKF